MRLNQETRNNVISCYPEVKRLIWKLERTKERIVKHKVSALSNETCYIYIYIYILLRKTKNSQIRIMNLFPSCYGHWYISITPKINRISSDPINTARMDTGGTGARGLMSFLPKSLTSNFSLFTGRNHNKVIRRMFKLWALYQENLNVHSWIILLSWRNYSRFRFNCTE